MKKNIILAVALILITAVATIYMNWGEFKQENNITFSANMTLKELAKENGAPLKEILHVLSHEDRTVWNLPRNIPIKELALEHQQIKHALEHIMEEKRPLLDIIKYILWAIWISGVVIIILQRKKIKKLRVLLLVLSVVIFGIFLGATPNPMESIVKLFKMINKMEGDPRILIISFIIFSLFSIIGSKMICGWGCQLGALQESMFNIPFFKKKYKFQLPFTLSLIIRIVIFVIFFLLLFGLVFGIKNFVIYHNINYFKIFNFHDLAAIALYSIPVMVVASLFIFRPFCQFICPFGLYAWLLENIAINRIKIDRDKCTECLKCVKSCPTQAMKGIYETKRKWFLPDCWSCGKCIETCPADAIVYGNKV